MKACAKVVKVKVQHFNDEGFSNRNLSHNRELSRKNLEKLANLSFLRNTFDEQLTNNTFDDHLSCQTFFQHFSDQLDVSDDHTCRYKQRYLIDQLKIAFQNKNDPSSQANIQMLTKALQKHNQDERRSDIATANMTDEEFFQHRKQPNEKQLDRQMRIQRYKNKKRNWEKKISYDSRKQIADQRLRIKGRFISKTDQRSIKKLVGSTEIYDLKKNLDIVKFDKQTNLFNYTTNPKSITKKIILKTIRDECLFKEQQANIVKSIQKQHQIFKIVRLR